jgi:hypothetical protein
VLSARLHVLESNGIVARRFYSEHPPRAEYALTDRGKELGVVVGALAVWGSRHLHRESALVHTDCETPLEVGYFCAHCRGRVRGGAVKLSQSSRGTAVKLSQSSRRGRTRGSCGSAPPTRRGGA